MTAAAARLRGPRAGRPATFRVDISGCGRAGEPELAGSAPGWPPRPAGRAAASPSFSAASRPSRAAVRSGGMSSRSLPAISGPDGGLAGRPLLRRRHVHRVGDHDAGEPSSAAQQVGQDLRGEGGRRRPGRCACTSRWPDITSPAPASMPGGERRQVLRGPAPPGSAASTGSSLVAVGGGVPVPREVLERGRDAGAPAGPRTAAATWAATAAGSAAERPGADHRAAAAARARRRPARSRR